MSHFQFNLPSLSNLLLLPSNFKTLLLKSALIQSSEPLLHPLLPQPLLNLKALRFFLHSFFSFFLFYTLLRFILTLFFFFKINSIPTKPIEGQKTGTSGLRKKVGNFVLFNSCFSRNIMHTFYLVIIDKNRGCVIVCFVGESVYARKLPCKLDSGL